MVKLLIKLTVLFVNCNNIKLNLQAWQGERGKEDVDQKSVNKTGKGNLLHEAQDCFACGFLNDSVLARSFFVQNLRQIVRG